MNAMNTLRTRQARLTAEAVVGLGAAAAILAGQTTAHASGGNGIVHGGHISLSPAQVSADAMLQHAVNTDTVLVFHPGGATTTAKAKLLQKAPKGQTGTSSYNFATNEGAHLKGQPADVHNTQRFAATETLVDGAHTTTEHISMDRLADGTFTASDEYTRDGKVTSLHVAVSPIDYAEVATSNKVFSQVAARASDIIYHAEHGLVAAPQPAPSLR